MNKKEQINVIDNILNQFPLLNQNKRDELRKKLEIVIEEDKKSTKEQQYKKVKNLLNEYTYGLNKKFLDFLEKQLGRENEELFKTCTKEFQNEFNNNIIREDRQLMQAVVSANRIRFEDTQCQEKNYQNVLEKKRKIDELVQISKRIKIQ
jgi:uncharacterized protein YdiU (UPF0061 family)